MNKGFCIGLLFASSSLLFASCDLSNGIKIANMDGEREQTKDSVEVEEEKEELQLFEDTPLPKAADELFDDFFFNFVSNPKFQTSRVVFPLKNVANYDIFLPSIFYLSHTAYYFLPITSCPLPADSYLPSVTCWLFPAAHY